MQAAPWYYNLISAGGLIAICCLAWLSGRNRRQACTEMLPDEKASSATCFLIRASNWLKRHGVKVKRVMTDNGSCYRSHLFRTAVQSLGVRHVRTRPYTPRTNGKAERFIQTRIKEWAYRQAYETSEERTQQLRPWTDFYNQQRPHTALKYQPPISRLENCEQRP